MLNLLDWLWKVPDYRLVPLFDSGDDLLVRTKEVGTERKRLLCRSLAMEQAIIELVEPGLKDVKWHGLLYIMGFGIGSTFRPLYVGKAEKRGGVKELSGNLVNIRQNRSKFAKWGDGLDYHIGDLSQTLFGFKAYRGPTRKYKRWAERLFEKVDPPKRKEPVFVVLAPGFGGSVGPAGLAGSLPAAEKEVIALASVQFADSLMNVDGI